METGFQLDNTFENYYKIFQNLGILKVYPQINDEIIKFKDILDRSPKILNSYCLDLFDIPINISGGTYYLNWNITQLENYLTDNLDKVTDVPLNALNIHSCPSRLIQDKCQQFIETPIDKPIILAYHFPFDQYLVIDGNHRYNAAKIRGDRSIKAIVLTPKEHIQFMYNELSKNLYIIHHNLTLLINLPKVPLQYKYKLSTNLGYTDYYPLTGNKIKFNRLKNIYIYIYFRYKKFPI